MFCRVRAVLHQLTAVIYAATGETGRSQLLSYIWYIIPDIYFEVIYIYIYIYLLGSGHSTNFSQLYAVIGVLGKQAEANYIKLLI